jgi:hypothetical protein
MLLSWFQSTLSSELFSRALGSVHVYELLDRLFNYFQKQTHAHACHLRVELHAIILQNSSIQEYLLRI